MKFLKAQQFLIFISVLLVVFCSLSLGYKKNDQNQVALTTPNQTIENKILLDSIAYTLDNDSCYSYVNRGKNYYVMHGTKASPSLVLDVVIGNNPPTDGEYDVTGGATLGKNKVGIALTDSLGQWVSNSGKLTLAHSNGHVTVTITHSILKNNSNTQQRSISGTMICE